MVERRKHKRFQAPKGLYAQVGPQNANVGRVDNLSIGGLAFTYVGSGGASNGSYLDLSFAHSFYLGQLRFQTISDYESVEKAPSFSSETMRRCGVKFKKLTRYQKAELERFIQNHAIGEAYARGESPFSIDKEVSFNGSFVTEQTSSTSIPQAAPKEIQEIDLTELGDHDFPEYAPIFQLLGVIGLAIWTILCLVANVDSFWLLVLFAVSVFSFMVPGLGLIYVFNLWNYLRGNHNQGYTMN
jgi:hypothetical protein